MLAAAKRAGIRSPDELAAISNEQVIVKKLLSDDSTDLLATLTPATGKRIENIVSIMRHYAPYIAQEEKASERAKNDEYIAIPKWLDYDKCKSIRFESREKLKVYRPETLAQASRSPGVNPTDVALLAIIIKRGHI